MGQGGGHAPEFNYDVTKPAGSTVGYDCDNWLRSNMQHESNQYAIEHYDVSDDVDFSEDDTGRHAFITLKEQAAKPDLSGSTNRHAFYTKSDGFYVEKDDATEIKIFDFTLAQVPYAAVQPFAAATNMLFGQATSPTGWTKKTNWQDGAMIVINSDADGTALASGGSVKPQDTHTHTGPSHTHTGPSHTHTLVNESRSVPYSYNGFSISHYWPVIDGGTGVTKQAEGGVATNQNVLSDITAASGTGSTGAGGTGATGANTAPYYQEAIWCTKD